MARFVFKLQAVLALREREELTARRAMAERQRDANQLRDELIQLNADLVQSQQDLRGSHLTGRLDPNYLSAHRRFTIDVSRRGRETMNKIGLADKLLEDARKELAVATQRRRAIERLRDKQEAEWREATERRDLAAADDDNNRWLAGVHADEDESMLAPQSREGEF